MSEEPFDGDRWCTPERALEPVYRFWPNGIDLDVCGDPDSVVRCDNAYDIRRGEDALELPWRLTNTRPGLFSVWLQPPYSNPGPFLERAIEIARGEKGWECLAMIPANTDTEWFHLHVGEAAAICFVRGRFKHLRRGVPGPAPKHRSMYALFPSDDRWRSSQARFQRAFGRMGLVK